MFLEAAVGRQSSSFQARGAAVSKARSPGDERVRGMTTVWDCVNLSSVLVLATARGMMRSDR